jgi:DNA-binding NarL/FixJ family response regulator
MPNQMSSTASTNNASLPDPIKIAIIEDQRTIREGLAALIDGTDGFRCTGCYGSMEEALKKIGQKAEDTPDVALLDIGLPGMSGLEGIGLLRKLCPAMPALMLTVYDDDDRIFKAICAGARGYLLKKTPPARLLESLREVVGGGAPMSPEIARRVLELFQQFHPPDQVDYQLTPHELRLLKLLVEGHNYKTAAKEVGTSVNTVSFHMKRIYEKLEVHSKSEAVAKALRDHIVI